MNEAFNATSISASAKVKDGFGVMDGFLCTASSSGTVKLWDNTSVATNVITDTMSVTAGTYYKVPACFSTGLYVTIGNTATITVFWR